MESDFINKQKKTSRYQKDLTMEVFFVMIFMMDWDSQSDLLKFDNRAIFNIGINL